MEPEGWKRDYAPVIVFGYGVIAFFLVPPLLCSQSLIFRDSVVIPFQHITPGGKIPLSYRLTRQLDYKLSALGSLFLNSDGNEAKNQISLMHQLRCRAMITNERNFKATGLLNHEIGLQWYIDSIWRFQPDVTSLEMKMEIRIIKYLLISINSTITSRIFNSHRYFTGSDGILNRQLQSGFLTPMIWTFASGFGWNNNRFGSFQVGLTGGKLTWVRYKAIYSILNVDKYFGVPHDKPFLFEFGLTMLVNVERKLSNAVKWTFELNAFKNYEKPIDFTLKNLFDWRLGKYFSGSVQTRLIYESEMTKKVQIENLFGFGIGFKL